MHKNWTRLFVSVFTAASVLTIPVIKTSAAVQTPITRSQVELRAISMVDLTWTYSADKNSNIDTKYASSVTLPKQLQGVTTAQITGIPYDWGGIDGVDTCSYNAPWTSFLEAVNKGAFTGNVNSTGGLGYVTGTAGMDCSGFVQAAFNIHDYKQNTTSLLNNYFVKIDMGSLKHMDILDKPGDHVAIFDRWGTMDGLYGAFTYEATTDQYHGGIQGTKRYFLSMNTLNSGYIPARYINIVEDAASQSGETGDAGTTTDGSAAQTTNISGTASAGTTGNPMDSTGITSSTGTTTSSATAQFKVGGYAQVSNVTTCANLRSNPGTSYTVLNTISKGTVLKLTNYSEGFYEVTYGGQIGWIKGSTLGTVPAGQYVTVSGVYQLNIRISASSTAQILGVLTQDQIAQRLGQTPDGSWYKITINGITGWSSSKYLTFIQ